MEADNYREKLLKLKALRDASLRRKAAVYDSLAADAYEHGRYLYDNECVEESAALFRRLALQHPLWSEAWYCLGMCDFRLHRLDQAQTSLTVSWMLSPENPLPLYALAQVTLAAGRSDEAKRLFQQVLAIASRDPKHFPLEEKAAKQLRGLNHG